MWPKIFEDNDISIDIRGNSAIAAAADADLDDIETQFSLRLPADYRAFCRELGAGTLGDLIHIDAPRTGGPGSLPDQIEFGWQRLEYERDDLPADVTENIRTWISFGSSADGYNFYWRADHRTEVGNIPIYVLTNNWPVEMIHVCDNFTEFVLNAGFGRLLVDVGAYGDIPEQPKRFDP